MKYFLDTEFIEYPRTIDLISIGLVREDGGEYYAISTEFDGSKASEWVKKNVINLLSDRYPMNDSPEERELASAWKSREQIKEDILAFTGEEYTGFVGGSPPEFWAYYGDYDWVAFCWLFGTMMDLPSGFPMYCRDIKQWADSLGNPELPRQAEGEHNALADAKHNRVMWEFLHDYERTQAR